GKFVFVTSSLDTSPRGSPWTVYAVNGNGEWTRLRESLALADASIFRSFRDGLLVYSSVANLGRGRGEIVEFGMMETGEFKVETHQTTEDEIAAIDRQESGISAPANNSQLQQSLGERVDFKVEKILLVEFQKNPSISWRSTDSKLAL